eukprot:gene6091-18135_t
MRLLSTPGGGAGFLTRAAPRELAAGAVAARVVVPRPGPRRGAPPLAAHSVLSSTAMCCGLRKGCREGGGRGGGLETDAGRPAPRASPAARGGGIAAPPIASVARLAFARLPSRISAPHGRGAQGRPDRVALVGDPMGETAADG